MRVLVVDDEPLACEAIVKILRERRDVESFEVAEDGARALELCAAKSFDVITLDLRMPEMDGMQVADHLRQLGADVPAIIFVTAFDDQAIAAFEREAADYVLKPFARERLHRALDSARRRTSREKSTLLDHLLPQLIQMTQSSTRIALKSKGQVVFLSPQDILFVRAERNYVLIQQRSGTNLLREQISILQERLEPFGFVRIHRSVLINSAYVESMEPLDTGEYLLRMKGGEPFNVTRTYKKNLKGLAHAWIGSEAQVTAG